MKHESIFMSDYGAFSYFYGTIYTGILWWNSNEINMKMYSNPISLKNFIHTLKRVSDLQHDDDFPYVNPS